MPPVDRKHPKRAKSTDSRYSIMEFKQDFRDDDACLDWLWRRRYAPDGHTTTCPKCERTRRFHRLAKQPAYSCDTCGHHLHPTARTIFHKSSTALWLWFYAMYLMSSTRCGISAKQLERQIGVTYKTAWRILNKIRAELMSQDGDKPLSGDVEIDKTYHGGKPRAKTLRDRTGNVAKTRRQTVFGLAAGKRMLTVVKLADLADSRSLVEDRKFEACEILGPAVLAPLEGVHFLNSSFDGSFDSLFREVPEGQPLMGVVGLRRVIFDRCKFTNIGIVATHEFLIMASEGFTPPD